MKVFQTPIFQNNRQGDVQFRRGGCGKRTSKPNGTRHSKVGYQTKTITFISELSKIIFDMFAESSNDLILFRGQRQIHKKLLPKVGRRETQLKGLDQKDLKKVEKQLFEEFKRFSPPFLDIKPETDLDWLSVAQHYGLPTRLLDWTTNSLAALWFAVKNVAEEKKSAVVWILNPEDGDFITDNEEKDPFNIQTVKIYRPRHITRRLIAQSGYFTVHPLGEETARFHPLEEDSVFSKRLTKIEIPFSAFSNIRDDLERHGACDLTMFPDLEGVCRFISWNNSLLGDETDPPYVRLNQ